jgi:hypothetical protein
MNLDGILRRSARTIKLIPIADITSISNNLKCMSNHKAKLMKVKSSNTSQIPLVKRNILLSETLFCFLNEIYAEIPDRKTKAGAQRCVIHLVKNIKVVVVCRFVGSWLIDVLCIKSRT